MFNCVITERLKDCSCRMMKQPQASQHRDIYNKKAALSAMEMKLVSALVGVTPICWL